MGESEPWRNLGEEHSTQEKAAGNGAKGGAPRGCREEPEARVAGAE